jgi:Asp-tRNA(Asn)/Glu-tRNA(Gln) amidotransferase B subunit
MNITFNFNFNESDADWWTKKTAVYKQEGCLSKIWLFSDILFLSVAAFANDQSLSQKTVKLYSKITINRLSSIFDGDDCRFWLFLLTHTIQILEFLEKHKDLNEKYLIDRVYDYTDTNQYFYLITFEELIDWKPCLIENNLDEIRKWCLEAVSANPKAVNDYKSGKLAALNSIKGFVMKRSAGKADINSVIKILEEILIR